MVLSESDVLSFACATTGQRPCGSKFLNLTSALHNPDFIWALKQQVPNIDIESLRGKDVSVLYDHENLKKESKNAHIRNIPSHSEYITQLLLQQGEIAYFSDRRLYHGRMGMNSTTVPDDFNKTGEHRAVLVSVHPDPNSYNVPTVPSFVQAYLNARTEKKQIGRA